MLRDALSPEVSGTVVADIPKRLIDTPVGDIAAKLVKEW
jgi:protein required for attachment to host cells